MTPAPAAAPETTTPVDDEQSLPYGENFIELPEQLVTALRETVKEFQGQERWVRRQEVKRAWKNRLYERGHQHIIWQNGSNGGFVGVSGGGTMAFGAVQSQAPRYLDAYNIYQPYLRVQMSILTQNLQEPKFKPQRPDKQEDQEAASTAEGYRHIFDRANNPKELALKIARTFGNDGRTVIWTRTEANAQKFGYNPDGTPRSRECSDIYGVIETKVPILSRSQGECLYLFISDDPDIKPAKSEYKDCPKVDQIKAGVSGLGENAYERLARLGVLQGARSEMLSAEAFNHLVTRMRCWLRPECWSDKRMEVELDEPAEGSQAVTVGDRMEELFPDGVCVTFVGDVYVGCYPQSMDDAIVIGFPYEGDGMNRMALMDPMIVVQDYFNDGKNASRECWDFGWPSTWVNAEDAEYDAMVRQRANPYSLRQKKVSVGAKTADQFFREPNPELPATFVQDMEIMSGALPQFILASPPVSFGAGDPDQQTSSGIAQLSAHAMGQQGLVFGQIQAMFAQMYYQAALLATKNPEYAQPIAVAGGSGPTATIDIGKISKGQFGCYPDEDSSFPESTQAKRTTLMGLIELIGPTPIGAQMLQAPKNLEIIADTNGLSELVIPGAQAWKKQMFEIEQLLKGTPIPVDVNAAKETLVQHAAGSMAAEVAGAPPPMLPPPPQPQPSVPVNDWDFHQFEAAACQDWLSSEDCRTEQGKGNQQGVQNVVLHWRAHVAALAAMTPPPMGPPMLPAPPPGAPRPNLPSVPMPAGAAATM